MKPRRCVVDTGRGTAAELGQPGCTVVTNWPFIDFMG